MKQFLYTSLILLFVTTQYHQANAQDWERLKTVPEDDSDPSTHDSYGSSVAMDGDFAVVGAPEYSDTDPNAVIDAAYILQKKATEWEIISKLTTTNTDEGFGSSVAISDDVIVVGAPYAANGGAAYVFEKPTNGWVDADTTTSSKLTASDGVANDYFGDSVAISGDVVVVGAYGDVPPLSSNFEIGAAYVFEKPASGWIDTDTATKLTANGGKQFDSFGWSVAIVGNLIAVGAHRAKVSGKEAGAVYLFEKNPAWTETTKLENSTEKEYFGFSIAISSTGDQIVVGARGDNGNDRFEGFAYVFEKSGTSWGKITKLKASDGQELNGFGNSVAISGNQIVVGAPSFDEKISGEAAYVFKKDTNNDWPETETAKLVASDTTADDNNHFGGSIAISDGVVVVGASATDSNTGAAYFFEKKNPASVEDVLVTKGIVLYPNPVSKTLSIQLNSGLTMKAIQIYDGIGREVKSLQGNLKKISVNKFSLNVNNFAKGIYFVKFTTNQGVGVKKILKK